MSKRLLLISLTKRLSLDLGEKENNGHGFTAELVFLHSFMQGPIKLTSLMMGKRSSLELKRLKEKHFSKCYNFYGQLFKSRNDIEGFFASVKDEKGKGLIRSGQFAYSYQANGLRDGVNLKPLKKDYQNFKKELQCLNFSQAARKKSSWRC